MAFGASGGKRPSEERGPAPEALVDCEELARLHVFVGCAIREATGREWWGLRTAGEWREIALAVGVTPVALPGVPDFTPRPVLARGRWFYYYPAGTPPEREARWLAAGVAWILIYQNRHRLPVAGEGRRTRSEGHEAMVLRAAVQTFVAGVFGRGDHGYLGRVRHLPPAPSVAKLVLSEAAPLVIGRGERWTPPEAPRPALAAPSYVGAQKGCGAVSECEVRGDAPGAGDGAAEGDGEGEGAPGMTEFGDYMGRLPEPMTSLLRVILEQVWALNNQVGALSRQSGALSQHSEALTRQCETMERVMSGQQEVMLRALDVILRASPETLGGG